jgi:hypothetical protein
VEWNPPQDAAYLKDAIRWPQNHETMEIRIIEVPKRIHRKLPGFNKRQMFEYIAKNVGVRRAKGRFVLVTNPDDLFSEELIAYLASNRLSEECFYRVDRYDFHAFAPEGVDTPAILDFAKRHIYHFCRGYPRKFHNRLAMSIANWYSQSPHALRRVWNRCARVLFAFLGITEPGSRIGWLQRWRALRTGKWPCSYDGYERSSNTESTFSLSADGPFVVGLDSIHHEASGDFLLASIDDWMKIKGHPEFTDTYSHMDSYATYQLKAIGLKQALFLPPCMIIHADHERIRARAKSFSGVQSSKWWEDLRKIQAGLLGPTINGDDWGLASEDLPETVVCKVLRSD